MLKDLQDVSDANPTQGQALVFNGSNWAPAQVAASSSPDLSGYMLKSNYDANSNNIVNDSEKLGNNLPSFYTNRSNHTGTQSVTTLSDFTTSTDSRINLKIQDQITNGVTTIAPSQNAVFDALQAKQATLISGTNIKTINGTSLLGSGNVVITSGTTGATNLSIVQNALSVAISSDTGSDVTIAQATSTSAGVLSSTDKSKLDTIAVNATANSTDAQLRSRSTHTGTQAIGTITGLDTALSSKQATLVSGTHIKTINNQSLLGSGNILIESSDALTTALSGLNTTLTGKVVSTDTVLSAFGKTQKQIDTLLMYIQPHTDSNIVDVGGGNPYPFDVSDGTLYTTSTIITLASGYYRFVLAAGPNYADRIEIRDTLTASLLAATHSSAQPFPPNIVYYLDPIWPGTLKNYGNAAQGWTDDPGDPSHAAFEFLFATAPYINRGYQALDPEGIGTSGGKLTVTRIIHVINPTEFQLTIPSLPPNSSTFDIASGGTGFIWIREVQPT